MSHGEIVTSVCSLLRGRYIFPEQAEAAATAIETESASGSYDEFDEQTLADHLTAKLREVCHDKHLAVRVRKVAAAATEAPQDPEVLLQHWRDGEAVGNFGIARLERLDGNIGYLDLRSVTEPGIGGPAILAAMELLSRTHALILDLRRNGGGSPDGSIMWCSFFFADEETHLNDIYDGETRTTKQFWSLAYLPVRRYVDPPVYVLTSDYTFSGAEEIAYNLQAQKRAELIGETTGGGAHPTMPFPISPTMMVAIPVARSINPVTGTNWEGVGVVPDVAVPADQAYDIAYQKALRHVLTIETMPQITESARSALDALGVS